VAALAGRRVLDLRALDPGELGGRELEIEEVPPGARLVDLRSKAAYDAWHPAAAEHLEFFQALERHRAFDRSPTWVFYCEVGLKSAHLAEVMQGEGFRAYHVAGGVRELMRREAAEDPLAAGLRSPALLTG
jgi:rhodanese-related sulfurtransferase